MLQINENARVIEPGAGGGGKDEAQAQAQAQANTFQLISFFGWLGFGCVPKNPANHSPTAAAAHPMGPAKCN